MPMARAAADMEPVRDTASRRSALPGPIATTAPMRIRIFGTSGEGIGNPASASPDHAAHDTLLPRRPGALVLLVVGDGPVLRLGKVRSVLLGRRIGLLLLRRGLRRVGRGGRQLRPGTAGEQQRETQECCANEHSSPPRYQCCACGAAGMPTAEPAFTFPDLTSLYQSSWCSLAHSSST